MHRSAYIIRNCWFQNVSIYTETGTIPDPSVGFSGAESGVSAAGESTGYDLYYNTDADKYAAEE